MGRIIEAKMSNDPIYQCEGCHRTYVEYVNGCLWCWDDDLTAEQNRARYPRRSVSLVFAA